PLLNVEVHPSQFGRNRFEPSAPVTRKILVRGKVTVDVEGETGKKQSVPAQVVAETPEWDLTILRVSLAEGFPASLDWGTQPEPEKTKPVWVFGFPGDKALTANRASVTGVGKNASGEVTAVQVAGDWQAAYNGGPVVDVQGRLVGVANIDSKTS